MTYSSLAPSPEDLASLSSLAQEMFDAEAAVASAEETLSRAKERLRHVSETSIPMLMTKVGMKDFRTTSGFRIRIDEMVSASIAPERKTEAYAWLDANGHSGLLRRRVSVEFTREQGEEARRLLDVARGAGFENVGEELSVHPSTLKAWAREQLASGGALPFDLFGVSQFQRAKITTTGPAL